MVTIDVLIATRDELLAAAYESFLVVEGYRVKIVGTGIDCLGLLRKQPPQLLVIDPQLPWGGMGILQMLCTKDEQFDIPVIILLDPYDPEPLPFLPHHASAVIFKPFVPTAMANLVQQLIPPDRNRFRLNHHVKGIQSLKRTIDWNRSPAIPNRSLAIN
ncbi:MAG: hypothetical protein U0798_14755 [Gemmataceae bacterium]